MITYCFFIESGVCHLSGDGRGERWAPHSFFFLFFLIRTSSKSTHLKQDELKVRKIMRISYFSICALYISAVLPIFVFFSQICRIC